MISGWERQSRRWKIAGIVVIHQHFCFAVSFRLLHELV